LIYKPPSPDIREIEIYKWDGAPEDDGLKEIFWENKENHSNIGDEGEFSRSVSTKIIAVDRERGLVVGMLHFDHTSSEAIIYVAPSYQRQGISRALYTYALEHIKGYVFTAVVGETNQPSIDLHNSMNFESTHDGGDIEFEVALSPDEEASWFENPTTETMTVVRKNILTK